MLVGEQARFLTVKDFWRWGRNKCEKVGANHRFTVSNYEEWMKIGEAIQEPLTLCQKLGDAIERDDEDMVMQWGDVYDRLIPSK